MQIGDEEEILPLRSPVQLLMGRADSFPLSFFPEASAFTPFPAGNRSSHDLGTSAYLKNGLNARSDF